MDPEHARALVGRDRELGELEHALGQVGHGEPWSVQIAGEPGIGKSRLLEELCRRAETRGYLVLEGRSAEFERDIPFGLIVDALNDFVGSLAPPTLRSLDEDVKLELATVFPALPRPEAEAGTPGQGSDRYRLHYAIRTLLQRLTERRPMLLALDDVHWADAGSVEVLTHLLRRFNGPLLTAVGYRHVPAHLLAALELPAVSGRVTRIDLAPLSQEDADRLMGETDEATRAVVFAESGGNPFYIEQLARAGSPRRLRSSDDPAQPGTAVPRTVLASIRRELIGVSAEGQLALGAAAVAGEMFEPELVAAIADRSAEDALAALDELLRFDFIRPTEAPRRFRFRHPIVRRAVYDGMPRGWRIGAHSRAAAALAAAQAPSSVRAHHVESSATPGDEQAIAVLVQAGRDAAPRAPETAGRWLLAATRLLPPGGSNERRVALMTEAASALTAAGAYDEALRVLGEASRLLPAERSRERAEMAGRIAFAKRMSGRPLESRALVMRTLRSVPPGTASAAALTMELAVDHYWRGEFDSMHDLAREVLSGAEGRPEQRLITAWAAGLCSMASSSLGRATEALAELELAKTAFATLSDEQLAKRIDVAGYVAQAASAVERPDDALECARRGLRVAETTGQSPYIPGQLVIEANALFMKGRIADAVAVAETATDAAVLTGNDQFAVWSLWTDTVVCSDAGDTSRALASAREAVTRSARLTETYFSSLSRLHLAAALLAAGDARDARVELGEFEAGSAQGLLDLRGGHGWELLVGTQLALGDIEAAARSAETAETRARSTSLPHRTATALCARAAVLRAQDDTDAAISLAREAAALGRSVDNPLLVARARALIGAGLAAADLNGATAELEAAERAFWAVGALREADAAAQELRRLGRRRPRRIRTAARSSSADALSAREREVAVLVAAGKRNRDVAAALFLSEKTVESHLARIYDKLGVRSRAALAAMIASERHGEG
jgi:ATP/maltotriose-dependent transcriptional regulator MalT